MGVVREKEKRGAEPPNGGKETEMARHKIIRGYLFDNNGNDTGRYYDFSILHTDIFDDIGEVTVEVSYQTFLELGLLMWRNGCWAGSWRDNDGLKMRFVYVTKDKKRMTYETQMPSHDYGPCTEGVKAECVTGCREKDGSYEIV